MDVLAYFFLNLKFSKFYDKKYYQRILMEFLMYVEAQ